MRVQQPTSTPQEPEQDIARRMHESWQKADRELKEYLQKNEAWARNRQVIKSHQDFRLDRVVVTQ